MTDCNRVDRKVRARRLRIWLAALILGSLSAAAQAHAPDQSYVFLRVYDDRIDGRVGMLIPDLNAAVGLELSENQDVTRADIEPHLERITRYLQDRVALAPNGQARPLRFESFDLVVIPLGQYLEMNFSFSGFAEPPETVDIFYNVLFDTRPSHRGFAVIEHHWKSGKLNNESDIGAVFGPGETQQTLTIGGSMLKGFLAMVGQGTHHIWIGLDHILFLIALLLPSVMRDEGRGWRPVGTFRPAFVYVVKIVTIFTVAHTITLSAAALGAISLPSRLVESIIALSIAAAALDVFVPVLRRRIWWVVFAFGLFHGFGFASVLADIGIGGEYLLHTLLGFNVGVEIGQLAIVAAAFPVLYLLRQFRLYPLVVMQAGATALVCISMYWFVERGFGIDIPGGKMLDYLVSLVA
jgi:hypothetical protein